MSAMEILVLRSLVEKVEDLINRYNRCAKDKNLMCWDFFLQDAVRTILENNFTDWKQIQHLRWLYKSHEIKRADISMIELNEMLKRAHYIHREDLTKDDVFNFVIKSYLPIFELKVKKMEIDSCWNAERIVIALNKFGLADDIRQILPDKIKMTCVCGHRDFAIFTNSGMISCFRSSCEYSDNKHNIWDFLENATVVKFGNLVKELYKELITDYQKNLEEMFGSDSLPKNLIRRSHNKEIKNDNLIKIAKTLVPNYDALIKQGFDKEVLIECDVLYRDHTVTDKCMEANDFRNRICYLIKDKDGNLVGIQGRSIFDDELIEEYVERDPIFTKLYGDNPDKFDKLKMKTINTYGFRKSDHLYLLYKHVDKVDSIRQLVITEGPKDAIRIFQQRIPNTAVVAAFGNTLSANQIGLIMEVFPKTTMIIMGMDCDSAGYRGSLTSASCLHAAGYDVKFALLPKKDDGYYNDWGDIIEKQEIIADAINNSVTEKIYKVEMEKRLSNNGIKEREKAII